MLVVLVRPALVVVGVGLLVWLAVAAGETSGWLHSFDVHTDDAINRRVAGHSALVGVWRVVTTVGAPLTWRVVAVAAAVVLWQRGRRRDAVLVVVVMVAAFVVSSAVKAAVGRARPTVPTPIEHVGGGSFPSGHALTSAAGLALAVLVSAGLPRLLRLGLCCAVGVAALLVASSRLALGVHYPTDILGGWLCAGLIAVITRAVITALRPDTQPGALSEDAPSGTRDGTIDDGRDRPV